MALGDAAARYGPCSVCKPPVQQAAEKVSTARRSLRPTMLPLTKGADDAWSRRAAGSDVQLRLAGGARAAGPSAAGDPPRSPIGRWSGSRRSSARSMSSSAGRRFRRRSCCGRLLLQALYTIRSERQLMEQLDYNLLFRWFVGLGMDDAVWSPTTFTKNRDRLLAGDIAAAFFEAVLIHADTRGCCRTSISRSTARCWRRGPVRRVSGRAGRGPARPRRRQSDGRISMAQRRRNATHQSTTDPDARLYKKARGPRSAARYSGMC